MLVVAAFSCLCAFACTTGLTLLPGTTSQDGSAQGSEAIGRLRLSVTLPNGSTVASVTYHITGPTTTTGMVAIDNAQSIEFVVGGLLAGSGYSIALTATDSMGDPCSGTASGFIIVAGATSNVGVTMICSRVGEAGGVGDVNTGPWAVDASAAPYCPVITSFVINPTEEPIGAASALSVATTSPATIAWSVAPGLPAGAGTLDSTTSATPIFTCTSGGNVEVTVTVGAPGSTACVGQPNTTMTGQIFCEGPGDGSQGTGRISAALTLPDATKITSVTYTVTGPTTTSGTIPIGTAQSVEFVVGGLLAGSGYSITMTATDSAGDLCSGTASGFTIVAGAITNVSVNMTCPHVSDAGVVADVGTGSLAVDGSGVVVEGGGAVFCPGITSFSITPTEEPVGATSALSVMTTIPATIAWSVAPGTPAGAGTLNSTTSASPTFTCTSGGTVEVTVAVGAPGTSACAGQPNTTVIGLIFCEGAGGGGAIDSSTIDSSPIDGGTDSCGVPALQSGCDADLAVIAPSVPLPPGRTTCSGTELALWQKDPRTDPTSCLNCLFLSGCLDDNLGDSGNECEDPFTGPGAGETTSECLAVLQCEVGDYASGCGARSAPANGTVLNAYCGPGESQSFCIASPGGACIAEEKAGFPPGFTSMDIVINHFGTKNYASGRANDIVGCGILSGCTTCTM
jgi:hypothetical protein